MPITKTQGIILNTSDFRSTSRMLTLFSPDYGKLKGIVKAARKEYLRYPSSMLLFSLNEIIFYPSRSSDLNLISFIDCKRFFTVFSDLEAFRYACLFVYLVDKALHAGERNKKVYELLLESLDSISSYKDREKIKFIFVLKFLDFIGFKPHILECLACGRKAGLVGGIYLSIKRGGLLCGSCAGREQALKISQGTLRSLLFFQERPFRKALNLSLDEASRKDIRGVLDSFITYHLEIPPLEVFA